MSFRVKLAAALLVLAGLPLASANAAITYTVTPSNQGDPGQPGGTIVDNFSTIDLVPQSSYLITGNGTLTCAAITNNTSNCNSSIGTPPLINSVPDLAGPPGVPSYVAVNNATTNTPGNVGFFQLGLTGLRTNNISFDWGTIDQWNFAQLLDPNGNALITVQGTALGATFNNGVPFSPGSDRITFNWAASDNVATLQLGDTFGPAFEAGNVSSVLPAAVPEPGTIGLMLAGLVGLVRARRRAAV